MGKALIDSNVVVDYLGRTLPKQGIRFISNERKKGLAMSIITKIELLGSRILNEELSLITDFINNATLIGLDGSVVESNSNSTKSFHTTCRFYNCRDSVGLRLNFDNQKCP